MFVEIAETVPPAAAEESGYGAGRRLRLERVGPRARLRYEGPFLALVGIALVLSFALPALRSRHAWVDVPCIFNTATGLPCLLCGMTRSFVYTAHGDLTAAFRMHMLGPPVFFLACAAFVYLSGAAVTGLRVRLDVPRAYRRAFWWSVLAAFVVFWILKLAFLKEYW